MNLLGSIVKCKGLVLLFGDVNFFAVAHQARDARKWPVKVSVITLGPVISASITYGAPFFTLPQPWNRH